MPGTISKAHLRVKPGRHFQVNGAAKAGRAAFCRPPFAMGHNLMTVRALVPHRLMPALRWTNQSVRAPLRRVRFTAARLKRNFEPSVHRRDRDSAHEIVTGLEQNGFAVLDSAFEKEGLARLRSDIDAALASGLVYPIARNSKTSDKAATLTDRELAKGEAYIKEHANIIYVRDPLITCPSVGAFVFSDRIIDLASEFYRCRPSITGCYLMKSFVNELPDAGFNFFHSDNQSARFIKFFLYLNDVGPGGGPFCYVPESHRRKPFGWRTNNTLALMDIERHYGTGSVVRLTGRVGDLIIANTTGFHRAEKPKQHARYALMINTGLHPIRHTIATTPKISRAMFERLTDRQRAIADFMQVV
jgi:ectoine hydroxylase-related dioxygenase (phytanoyl-CoA dioxygenase family)